MGLLETDNGWPGNGWTVGSENPAGWRYWPGDDNLGPMRPMPAGTVYAEWEFYWDKPFTDWIRIGLNCRQSGAVYDPNGATCLVRCNGDLGLVPQSFGGGYYLVGDEGTHNVGVHNSANDPVTIGLGSVGSDTYVYVDGVLVLHLTGNTAPTGTYAMACPFNGAGMHLNELRFYDSFPVPPSPSLIEVDDCWPGNGWVGGTESPPGWRYFAGTGQGATGPYRPMPAGTVYAEFDGYWDQVSGDNFLRVGIGCNNSALAWNPNGYSVTIRVSDGALTVQGGTYVQGSDNSFKIGMHHAPGFAFTIGIGIDGSDMLVYYEGQVVYRLTNMTAPMGTYALASAYNGAGGHYNEVRFYDALPELTEPVPLPELLEVDDCWPGNGWVDGTESPTGWRYFAGTGQGHTGPRRPTPVGTVYAEWDFYWDATGGDRFVRMGIWSPDMLAWNPGGYSVTVNPATGQVDLPWSSNTPYLVGSPGSVVLGARRTPATAATLGIGIIDGDTAVYVDGKMVYRVRTYGLPLGSWTIASAYNGAGSHFNQVRFYSVLPTSSGEPFTPLAIGRVQSDLNIGVGSTDAARQAGIQSDLNLGVGQADAARKASVQADVNPTRIFGIQADVNVTVLYSGGSGNMPIGPGLDSR